MSAPNAPDPARPADPVRDYRMPKRAIIRGWVLALSCVWLVVWGLVALNYQDRQVTPPWWPFLAAPLFFAAASPWAERWEERHSGGPDSPEKVR